MKEPDAAGSYGEILTALISSHEDWLMQRILQYAKARGYGRYTSTLQEAWRLSISGLSASLIDSLAWTDAAIELGPDMDFTRDPVAAFGIVEAQRHKARGVNLEMFLGLMKYYRQSYADLIADADLVTELRTWSMHRVRRFFDRIEIGFCVAWTEEAGSDAWVALQAENRRMTNEKNKYLTLFESMPQAAFLVDESGSVENMNQAATRMFEEERIPGAHYYHEAFESGHDFPAKHRMNPVGELLPWLKEDFDRFMADSSQTRQMDRQTPWEAGARHYHLRFSKLLDVSGKFTGAVIIVEDLTDRARAETALRSSEAALRAIFNSSYDALCIFDLDGALKKVNDSMLKMFQVGRDQAREIRFREDLSAEETLSEDLEKIWALAVAGETQIFEWRAKRFRDATPFDAEIVLRKITLGDGEVILAAVRDITERKAGERERLQREKLEGTLEMAGSVCHELNQPLMAISGYSELALMTLDPGHALYGKVHKISEQVQRMGDITQRLMRLTRQKRRSAGRKAERPKTVRFPGDSAGTEP